MTINSAYRNLYQNARLVCQLAIFGMTLGYLPGQTPASLTPEVETSFEKFASADWNVRSAGFYQLVKLGTATDKGSKFPVSDGVLAFANLSRESRTALVHHLNKLLVTENDFILSGSAPSSEDYSTYYGDVIEAATTLRDPSSLAVLLDSINSGGMAVRAIAGFGDPAVEDAVFKMATADEDTRHSLFRMLTQMTEARNLAHLKKKNSVDLLRNTLIAGAKDSNPHTRRIVVEGLGRINTPDVIELLQHLASSDPFIVSPGTDAAHYPVREAATKALQSIDVNQ